MTADKVALIVGGGSGLGAGAAQELAKKGHNLSILSSSGKGEALAKELGGIGYTGSNRNVADLQRIIDMTMDRWGRIDILINSAGHGPKGLVLDITDDEWH